MGRGRRCARVAATMVTALVALGSPAHAADSDIEFLGDTSVTLDRAYTDAGVPTPDRASFTTHLANTSAETTTVSFVAPPAGLHVAPDGPVTLGPGEAVAVRIWRDTSPLAGPQTVIATSTTGGVATVQVKPATAAGMVEGWWTDTAVPVLRTLLEIVVVGLVILLLAGLIANDFLGYLRRLPRAGAWIGFVGYALCALGGAAVLAVRAGRPSLLDGPAAWLYDRRDWLAAPIAVLLVVGVAIGICAAVARWRDVEGSHRGGWDTRRIASWAASCAAALLLALGMLGVLVALDAGGRPDDTTRPWWILGLALIGIGILVLAWRSVFRALITVAPGDAAPTTGIVLRLPAAAESLTAAGLPRINFVDGTDVPEVPADALAVVPSNAALVALQAVVTTLRPGTAFQLVVHAHDPTTTADEDPSRLRVHAVLRRSGTDVAPVTFDTNEFMPADGGDDPGRPAAMEVATTVVAAWLLVTLSVELNLGSRRGLYGARDWRSVALQALAVERQAAEDRPAARHLHERSKSLDPENLCVRFNQLKFELEASGTSADHDALVAELRDLTETVECRYPLMQLALRCRYQLTAQYLYDDDDRLRASALTLLDASHRAARLRWHHHFRFTRPETDTELDTYRDRLAATTTDPPYRRDPRALRARWTMSASERRAAGQYGEWIQPSVLLLIAHVVMSPDVTPDYAGWKRLVDKLDRLFPDGDQARETRVRYNFACFCCARATSLDGRRAALLKPLAREALHALLTMWPPAVESDGPLIEAFAALRDPATDLDAGAHHLAAALDALAAPPADPAQAQSWTECRDQLRTALDATSSRLLDRAERELAAPLTDVELARWALRDPSLAPLRAVPPPTAGDDRFDTFVSFYGRLAASGAHAPPRRLVVAGLMPPCALYLTTLADIGASADEVTAAFVSDNWERGISHLQGLAGQVCPEGITNLLDLIDVEAIGTRGAAWLVAVGVTSIDDLVAQPLDRLQDRVAAHAASVGDDQVLGTPPDIREVRAWRRAAARRLRSTGRLAVWIRSTAPVWPG